MDIPTSLFNHLVCSWCTANLMSDPLLETLLIFPKPHISSSMQGISWKAVGRKGIATVTIETHSLLLEERSVRSICGK